MKKSSLVLSLILLTNIFACEESNKDHLLAVAIIEHPPYKPCDYLWWDSKYFTECENGVHLSFSKIEFFACTIFQLSTDEQIEEATECLMNSCGDHNCDFCNLFDHRSMINRLEECTGYEPVNDFGLPVW